MVDSTLQKFPLEGIVQRVQVHTCMCSVYKCTGVCAGVQSVHVCVCVCVQEYTVHLNEEVRRVNCNVRNFETLKVS